MGVISIFIQFFPQTDGVIYCWAIRACTPAKTGESTWGRTGSHCNVPLYFTRLDKNLLPIIGGSGIVGTSLTSSLASPLRIFPRVLATETRSERFRGFRDLSFFLPSISLRGPPQSLWQYSKGSPSSTTSNAKLNLFLSARYRNQNTIR